MRRRCYLCHSAGYPRVRRVARYGAKNVVVRCCYKRVAPMVHENQNFGRADHIAGAGKLMAVTVEPPGAAPDC
ncbi:hypothetical protein PQ469_00065 [Mucilaginibacter sp. KACC 22773]|uniref:hypothetical protein n=1 Tax=Mucilaginibacter sp. KACC 22773 TaxID=3025671 RepID=UPI0023673093|nr:hypothetical protein [Mucilaginibacter sp. KACC 22773]WDF78399.1 hypothetical protein PQ469_00065 [Mucilaginibacter sp. KACC 22773]